MSAKQCPGNHQFSIIDICWKALVGEDLFKIAWPQVRHLNSQLPKAQEKYESILCTNVR